MAHTVRRIVTGHDADGKAIVASDEEMTGVASPSRPGISRCEIWSADKMPVDNSEGAAAEAQRKGFVVRHNYVGSGQGNVCRIVEFSPGGTPFMHRTETLDYAILLKGECDLELDDGKTGAHETGRHLRAARHDARLGADRPRALRLRLHPDRRRPGRDGRQETDDGLPDAVGRLQASG